MTAGQFLATAWEWHPSVLVGSALALAAYFRWAKPVSPARATAFVSAVLLLAFTLVSPMDPLSDDYLFSVHMLQHMFMVQLISPLFVLGVPPHTWRWILTWRPADRIEDVLGRPVIAWLSHIAVMLAWHVPYFYDLALEYEPLHVLEHLMFLTTGVIFWWPVVAPVRERMHPLASAFYLFLAAAATSVLGIVLAFAPAGTYVYYVRPHGDPTVTHLVRTAWGLNPQADELLGGMFMWVLGGFGYLIAIALVVIRWYSAPEPTEEAAG